MQVAESAPLELDLSFDLQRSLPMLQIGLVLVLLTAFAIALASVLTTAKVEVA